MDQTKVQSLGCVHGAQKATQLLSDEHRVIERVVEAVDSMAGKPIAALEPWKKALDFIRHFADQCHHLKEEKILFPAMEEHGIPNDGGPIGMMLVEHEEARAFVRSMLAAISLIETGNAAAKDSLAGSARAYCRLLREHIRKEDEILFPMADEAIPAEEQRQLLSTFETHEAEEMGVGVHEKYLQLAAELAGTS